MNQRVYTIINDLHMGNLSGADDFHTSGASPLLNYLIREVTADPEHHLVVLGDFFELWHINRGNIKCQMKDFWGISSATERRLNRLSIYTIKALAFSSKEILQKKFGLIGEEILYFKFIY